MPAKDRERLERLLLILDFDLYKNIYLPFREENKSLPELISELKKKNREEIFNILDESDRDKISTQREKYSKRYNLSQTAKVLEVPRQTVYYWIKKRWVTPKRDFRNYPFFTVFDIKEILKWRNELSFSNSCRNLKRTIGLNNIT